MNKIYIRRIKRDIKRVKVHGGDFLEFAKPH